MTGTLVLYSPGGVVDDYIVDMLPPVEHWGSEFFTTPTPDAMSGDLIKIVGKSAFEQFIL